MPPFRLEAPERLPTHSRKPQIIYTKNRYRESVKFEHWQERLEHRPVDVNPYCQGKVNYFLSHYNRLGTYDDNSFNTTTKDMLEQVFIKDKMVPRKFMDNYYTYNDDAECLTEYPETHCPAMCADEFITTMQDSYKVPKPYVMQRLAFPTIPFMQNRKYLQELPDQSPYKFYDDGFHFATCELRKHKGSRFQSFSPMTGTYTNAGEKESE